MEDGDLQCVKAASKSKTLNQTHLLATNKTQ